MKYKAYDDCMETPWDKIDNWPSENLQDFRELGEAYELRGFWDAEIAQQSPTSVNTRCFTPSQKHNNGYQVPRYDFNQVKAYVEHCSTKLSLERLEIYSLYWSQCRPVGYIQHALGLNRNAVKRRVWLLRAASRAWSLKGL